MEVIEQPTDHDPRRQKLDAEIETEPVVRVRSEMAETRETVSAALDQAFREGGDLVTRWALVAEVIDGDGARSVWTLAPPEAKAWDTLGLLTFAQQIEQAEAVKQAMEDQ